MDNPRKTLALAATFGLIGVFLSSCASTTQLERSWTAPEAGSIRFNRIMVIAMAPDEALRRSAEDAMRQQIERAEAVPSYKLLSSIDALKDRAQVAEAIRTVGADGLVVMRLVSDENEVRYTPGRAMPLPYTSFWGYYTRPYALAPFYWDDRREVRTYRVVGIETNIYRTDDESLLWSGFTRTVDPDDVPSLVAEVATVVRARLREQGLIAQP